MILLPGTKNTMEDLLWMRQNGLEAAVLKAAAAGKVIFGVCGGFRCSEYAERSAACRSRRNDQRNGTPADGYRICR